MTNDEGEELAILTIRATDAYNEAQAAKTPRARSRAETRFYAACESIYWVLRASAHGLK